VSLGFDVVSVKQMTATRGSPPEESKVPWNFLSATLLTGWRVIEPRMLLPSVTTASS
jgi:hypothetical protein